MKSTTLAVLFLLILVSCKKDEPETDPVDNDTNLTVYGDGLTDIENNSYTSVIIGNQEWMAENLKTIRFTNGDTIPHIEESNEWIQSTNPAWCYYDNESSNNSDFGKLYNWYAANDDRKICPTGWRLPSINDYLELMNYIDSEGTLSANNAGSQLKTKGNQDSNTGLWISNNSDATNAYSFNGEPSGKRNYQFGANFFTKFYNASFWTSTESGAENAVHMSLYHDSSVIDTVEINKGMGICIRCIKN